MASNIILTGDRPTGPLHLGHFVGSLVNRVALQHEYKQYILIADVQAFTDNFDNPHKVRENIMQVALDYLSVGIDPEKSTIFIQSMVPEIAELAVFFMNFVTVNRLRRNPTIKTEIDQKGYGENVTVGFLTYPIHQAADITIVKGSLVPAGEDQLPIIEQANEIIRSFNRTYSAEIFPEIKPLISSVPRLTGIDGKAKMSKSLGNAIFLSDSADAVTKKVMSMYTDPDHIRVSDPGKVEGNTVFTYLDVFDDNKEEVSDLKIHYRKGGLGDVVLKRRLADVINGILEPIRQRRAELMSRPDYIKQVLHEGTQQARMVAQQTMEEVKAAMKLDYKNL